jgi:hypothetical protein
MTAVRIHYRPLLPRKKSICLKPKAKNAAEPENKLLVW